MDTQQSPAHTISRPATADEMLKAMALAGQGRREAGGVVARPQIARVRYTHEAMIEEIIRDPAIHQNTLAEIFGFSPAWISTVINSDAFQAKLAATKDELINPELRLQLNERFRALTTRSLQVLQEKLAQPVGMISDGLALKAAELGAKALGLGAATQQVVVVNTGDRLSSLAARLTNLMGAQGGVVDVEVRDVTRD